MSYFKLSLPFFVLLCLSAPSFSQGIFMGAMTEVHSFDDKTKALGKASLLYVRTHQMEKGDRVGDFMERLDSTSFWFKVPGLDTLSRERLELEVGSHYIVEGDAYIDLVLKQERGGEYSPMSDTVLKVIPLPVQRSYSRKVRKNGKEYRIYGCDRGSKGMAPCRLKEVKGGAAGKNEEGS